MKLLEDRIRKDGKIKGGDVLKVDSFLNHQMDVDLFNEIPVRQKSGESCAILPSRVCIMKS